MCETRGEGVVVSCVACSWGLVLSGRCARGRVGPHLCGERAFDGEGLLEAGAERGGAGAVAIVGVDVDAAHFVGGDVEVVLAEHEWGVARGGDPGGFAGFLVVDAEEEFFGAGVGGVPGEGEFGGGEFAFEVDLEEARALARGGEVAAVAEDGCTCEGAVVGVAFEGDRERVVGGCVGGVVRDVGRLDLCWRADAAGEGEREGDEGE